MRNIVIERIAEYLRLYTDLMYELDITPEELDRFSNVDLLTLLEDIVVIINTES